MATPISTEEFVSRHRTFQVVDVRRRQDFDASPQMISRAVWGNPEDIDSWTAVLDPHRPVVVYCAQGRQVSQGCAEALEKVGFTARYLEGGFEKWAAENKPLVTKLEGGIL